MPMLAVFFNSIPQQISRTFCPSSSKLWMYFMNFYAEKENLNLILKLYFLENQKTNSEFRFLDKNKTNLGWPS